ncbi:hypothetical protein FHU30_002366 [Actinomadura rupiterrae]|nr:hypothetical protein [Actinomadura rupiterrae]
MPGAEAAGGSAAPKDGGLASAPMEGVWNVVAGSSGWPSRLSPVAWVRSASSCAGRIAGAWGDVLGPSCARGSSGLVSGSGEVARSSFGRKSSSSLATSGLEAADAWFVWDVGTLSWPVGASRRVTEGPVASGLRTVIQSSSSSWAGASSVRAGGGRLIAVRHTSPASGGGVALWGPSSAPGGAASTALAGSLCGDGASGFGTCGCGSAVSRGDCLSGVGAARPSSVGCGTRRGTDDFAHSDPLKLVQGSSLSSGAGVGSGT